MGILDKVFKSKSHVYGLTELGKEKHDKMNVESPMLDVLVYLNDNGSASTHEISENTSMSEKKVSAIVSRLEKDGLVEPKGR